MRFSHQELEERQRQREPKSYRRTGPKAFETFDEKIKQTYSESTYSTWRTAYRRYQSMMEGTCEPEEEEMLTETRIDPSWTKEHPNRKHPCRRIYEMLFFGIPPKKTNFRQTAPNEWQFEGGEIQYVVTTSGKGSVLEAYHKKTGKQWMHREYE